MVAGLSRQVAAPDRLQDLLDKLGAFDHGFTGWSRRRHPRGITFPGTTHLFGHACTDLAYDEDSARAPPSR